MTFLFYRFLGLEKLTFLFSLPRWLKFFLYKAYDWKLKIFLVPTARTMKFWFDCNIEIKICLFRGWLWIHF